MEFFENFLAIVLFTLWIMVVVAFFVVLFRVIGDLFRDRELGGVAKTIWFIVVILFPFLGVLTHLIARGKGMAKRDVAAMQAAHDAQVEYTRGLMGEAGTAGEIKAAKELLDAGTISQAEFDAITAKALAK